MPQPPRNDGWKHKGASPANKPAAQHTPNTSRKQWQPGAPKPKTTGKRTSRAARFVLAGVVVGLLSAAVVTLVLLLWPSKYPNFVIVAPDEADSLALPENEAGKATAEGIQEWATGDKELRGTLTARREETAARDDADPREAWAKKLDDKNDSTVVYFAVHVGVDATGPYLWLPRAKGGPPEKLYVEAVLQTLGKRNKPTLLVIDIAQAPPNWAFGGAYCDFPQAMKAKAMDDKMEAAGPVAVLLSADAGQTSWAAEERRKTAFGYHFLEGLRGAVNMPGQAVTAADLAKHLRTEVQKWAVANREANQEPLLLPAGSGEARAKKVTLTTLPAAAYTPPGPPAAAPKTPPALTAEWARVASLTDPKRGTPPDTADPLVWREYLEWLLRWERLVRLNAVPPGLPGKVQAMGARLADPTATAATCEAVALPAGPALTGVTPENKDLPFGRLWAPRADKGYDLGKEWAELKAQSQVSTPALQVAAARYAVERVLADGVSRKSLDAAELVLKEVGGVQPVEAHYLRMLQRHLPADESAWPKGLLKRAVELRRTAEETAWATGQSSPEQTFRWTQQAIADADRERQLGEDLLFGIDPASHTQAAAHLATAEEGYAAARRRAAVVSQALVARDKVFARLPYYARWAAAARGGPAKPDELVAKLERAARAAHAIDRAVTGDANGDANGLAALVDEAKAFDEVVKAFEDATATLTDQDQASNWHALDAALNVPFRKADARDWSLFARTVAEKLGGKPLPAVVGRASDADPLPAAAERHLLAAAAHLEEPNLARGPVLPARSDALVTALRGLPGKAAKARDEADNKGKLSDAGGDYAAANRHARLGDPAGPAGGTPDAPEADRRFRRHYFLLAHAGRIVRDGWCGTNSYEAVDNWYCSRAAAVVLADANAELGALVPGRADLAPDREARLGLDLKAARALRPTTLNERAEKRVVVPHEFRLRHKLTLTATGGPVGYPVWEYALPAGMAEVEANRKTAARQVERGLTGQTGASVTRDQTFDRGGATIPAESKLAAVVRYRGRVYEHQVTLDSAADYVLRVENTPPTGKAAIGLQAAPDAITGAVTVLIDRSGSMGDAVTGGTDRRILQAREGIKRLIAGMPPGTQLTVAGFHGKGKVLACDPLVRRFVVREPEADAVKLFKDLEKLAEPVDGALTPLAGAMRVILDPATGDDFWPAGFTGRRTLIVITDGKDSWYDDGKADPGYKVDGRLVADGEQWRVVEDGLQAALKKAKAGGRQFFGVDVHMTLFGIGDAEEQAVEKQFSPLKKLKATQPELAGTQFSVFKGVKSGKDFADRLHQAVMPRVWYSGSVTNQAGMLESTRTTDDSYLSTEELAPDTFDLTDGTKTFPRVQLGPGERMLLLVEPDGRDGRKVKITRPPFATQLAKDLSRPVATSDPVGPGVALTLPFLKYTPRNKGGSLEAVLTFEKLDPNPDANPLRAASRDYAWFDLTLPNDKAFDPADPPKVTIVNRRERSESGDRYELLAPAWDVTVENWGRSEGRKFTRPDVTGYWVNGLPRNHPEQVVVPEPPANDAPGGLPLRAFEFGSGRVEVLDAAVRRGADGGLYATVWMDYRKPGELVLLRPREWQQDRVPEAHTYYERRGQPNEYARYTAEFGPLLPSQLGKPVTFELYTVEDFREGARKSKLTVRLPGKEDCGDADQYHKLPDRLKMVGKLAN